MKPSDSIVEVIIRVLEVWGVISAIALSSGVLVTGSRDITNHFKDPYCEEARLGNKVIKKCWLAIELSNAP